MDPGTTVRTSRIDLPNTFSPIEKPLENSRERLCVNCFAKRKDRWMFTHNCSVSPGVSPRVGRTLTYLLLTMTFKRALMRLVRIKSEILHLGAAAR